MTIISLFDGSGGFPLAATICGMIPLYASEIEPYPIAVTRSRFPQMTHLDDVKLIEFLERYEILDTEGEIYTIREVIPDA